MSNTRQYKAYLRVRRFDTREVIDSIGVASLSPRHIEKAMSGLLRQMNTEEYFIDDSEVDEARAREDAKENANAN